MCHYSMDILGNKENIEGKDSVSLVCYNYLCILVCAGQIMLGKKEETCNIDPWTVWATK